MNKRIPILLSLFLFTSLQAADDDSVIVTTTGGDEVRTTETSVSSSSVESFKSGDFQAESSKIEALKSSLLDTHLAMRQLRVQLIQNDPELKKLHKEIMGLYKELASKIDHKPEMRELVLKERDLRSELGSINAEMSKRRIMNEAQKVREDVKKDSLYE